MSSLTLSSCINAAEKYCNINKGRRAYDLYADSAIPSKIDVPKLIDPLDLGPARVAKDGTKPENSLQLAIIGFYDPAYLNLYKQPPGKDFEWEGVDPRCKTNCEFRKTRMTTTVTTEVGFDQLRNNCTWSKPISLSRDVDTDVVVEDNPPPLSDVELNQTIRRNNFQDSLIRASNASCNEFKDNLLLIRADTGFLATASSVIFGALGAAAGAVGSISAAPVLAGASGASAGVGEAFDSAYFQEQVTKIINDGIDNKRAEVLGRIAKRREDGITSYGIDAAIADIENYHGACSIRSGLDKAEKTLAKQIEEIKERLDTRLEELKAPGPEDEGSGGGAPDGADRSAESNARTRASGNAAGGRDINSGSEPRTVAPRAAPPMAGF